MVQSLKQIIAALSHSCILSEFIYSFNGRIALRAFQAVQLSEDGRLCFNLERS